jgi:hypothetical protein
LPVVRKQKEIEGMAEERIKLPSSLPSPLEGEGVLVSLAPEIIIGVTQGDFPLRAEPRDEGGVRGGSCFYPGSFCGDTLLTMKDRPK